jgi:hypothetical protein
MCYIPSNGKNERTNWGTCEKEASNMPERTEKITNKMSA